MHHKSNNICTREFRANVSPKFSIQEFYSGSTHRGGGNSVQEKFCPGEILPGKILAQPLKRPENIIPKFGTEFFPQGFFLAEVSPRYLNHFDFSRPNKALGGMGSLQRVLELR
jgi:hypothetical protein